MRSPRYWAVILLLSLTGLLLYRRGDVDYSPPSTPLNELPHDLGPWSSIDLPIDPAVLQVLGKGIFLNREYSVSAQPDTALPATAENGTIGLFIGYFPTQRSGQSIHSPQNCLPGAGWTFQSSGVTNIRVPGGKTLQVGEYLVTNGTTTDEVLYWYQTHGRAIANDYKAKIYMLADAIRYNRTDAALIRIVTPLARGESAAAAHDRALAFAQQAVPLLPAYIPD